MSASNVDSAPNMNPELANLALRTREKINNEMSPAVRKTLCRYGLGCTQVFDPVHKEKFWHPSVPRLNDEQIKSQFICNECGYGTSSLTDLQMHLKRKTAWTNSSLLGCRISCLVDYREWHEGVVTQFHKSGKHFVEFRLVNEKRWLLMRKIAFYIVQRPPAPVRHFGSIPGSSSSPPNSGASPSGEYKDSSGDMPQEEGWVYSEDISAEYAFAQSVLFKIYGNSVQETGHLTKGHVCLTESDRLNAQNVKVSLLYGELLPRGANKAFGPKRLSAGTGQVLYDLGMGTGKILVQAFLQFKNLKYVYGVEMSAGRYKIAEESLLKMVSLLGRDNYHIEMSPGKYIVVTEGVRGEQISPRGANSRDEDDTVDDRPAADPDLKGGGSPRSRRSRSRSGTESDFECVERVLHLECGNLFDVAGHIHMADMVMMETDVPSDLHAELHRLLGRMHDGARLLSYLDLRRIWENAPPPLAFRQLEVNRHLSDRYPTSWSVQRGHHFYFWMKTSGLPSVKEGGGSTAGDGVRSTARTQASNSRKTTNDNSSSLVSFHNYNSASGTYSQSRSYGGPVGGGGKPDSSHNASADEPRLSNESDPRDAAAAEEEECSDQFHGDDDDLSTVDEGQCLPCWFSSTLLGWLRRRLSGGSKSRVSVGMFEEPGDDNSRGNVTGGMRDLEAHKLLRQSTPTLQPSERTNGPAPRAHDESNPEVRSVSLRSNGPNANTSYRKFKKNSNKASAASFAALSLSDPVDAAISSARITEFPGLTFTSSASVASDLHSADVSPSGSRRSQMRSESVMGVRPNNNLLLDSSGGGLYFGLQDADPPLYGYREGDDSTAVGGNETDVSVLPDMSDSQRSDDGLDLPPLSSGYRTPPRGANYEEGSSPNVMLTFRNAPSPSPIAGGAGSRGHSPSPSPQKLFFDHTTVNDIEPSIAQNELQQPVVSDTVLIETDKKDVVPSEQ